MAKFNIKTVKPKFVVATAPETKIDVSINRPIITAKNQKAYFKLKNTGGPKGDKGDTGNAATITVGSTSTGAPGTNASVTNSGTSSAAVLNFTIPRGDKGDKGDTGATGSPGAAATVTVGTTTTGQPGTSASVVNAGTQSAAVLNFTIPKGAKGDTGAAGSAATVAVGTTTTGQPGTNASVTNSGTQSAAVLNFIIPKGAKGDTGSAGAAATIAAGTTTTGQPGTSASVTNVGTSSAAIFDFTIPKGDKGDQGNPGAAATVTVGSTQTGGAGTSASVVNSGTSSAAVLDFTIPKGDKGDTGNPGSAATIAVGTVTTGQAGTSASVTNTGTSSAAVLDFTIPRGDTGATGADGYSPTASVSKSGDTATITITDKNGTTTASVTEPTVDSALSWTSQNPVENQTIRNSIWVKNSSGDKEAGINIAFSNPNLNPYVHLGSKTSATKGINSVGIGNNAEASAVRSVAIGNAATASKREGVALGPNATAGQYSLSIGYYTETVPNYSTAVGPYAKVLTGATNATAIGYESEASEAETVSVGKSTNKRRIVNVADGTTATDAATVGQIPTKTSDLTNDGADNTSTYVEADELAAVATSGSYNDLSNKPTIPAAQVNSDWSANSGVAQILNKPTLATVATSGSYNDLSNKPTIPAAQVNSDWNASSGVAQILNKPTLAAVATSGAYNDLSGKPTIPTKTSDLTNDGSDNTAQYLETDETAYKTASIPYGQCDSTSTSTVFTATVPGVTELRDGVCMWLKNGVVTSASGFTININNLGAKPVYNNMAAATRDTTLWNVNYTMLFVYDSTRVEGGCWILYRGYNSDTNTIGYQLRTNSSTLPAKQTGYRYRLWLTSADGQNYVPINTSSSTSTTGTKALNTTTPIDPFGTIVYNSTNGTVNANANLPTGTQWTQYVLDMRYAKYPLTLTFPEPVYLQCTPQTSGNGALINDIVQALPTTEDGKIYIYLGNAYSATNMELKQDHPVYYFKDGQIRLWSGETVPTLYTTTGQNTDGAVTQKLFSDTVGNVETILQTLNNGGGAR